MVNKYQRKLFSLFIIIITFLAYSCATYHPVYPEPVNIKTIIKPGESVKITTKDEKVYEFEVVEITDDAIVGESDKVLFTDIHKLQEMTVTAGENTVNVIGRYSTHDNIKPRALMEQQDQYKCLNNE